MNSRLDYNKALALRLQGQTYGEIRGVLGVPKSTLSNWFSELKVGNNAQKILRSKRKNGYLKLVEFNKKRTIGIREENERIRKKYELQIGRINDRELAILGAALYWGEGYKNFTLKKGAYPYICFGNSDPEMISVFMEFLEKIVGVAKERMTGQVMIYPGMDAEKSINYWYRISHIPRDRIRHQVALSRASRGKRPKHLLPFGTFQIRVSRRQDFFRVRGLMDGIIKALI